MKKIRNNYIDSVECTKIIINDKLNNARNNFNKEKNQKNRDYYLELINDMRALNSLDKKVIKKYLGENGGKYE